MLSALLRLPAVVMPMCMAQAGPLRVERLTKAYAGAAALHAVSLDVGEGEIVSVTGPSGAGKSTLGRLVSGLETAEEGRIVLAGQDLCDLPARGRRVAHMFESYALYPTLTVAGNIALPLSAPTSLGRWTAAQQLERVDEVLALTQMAPYRDRLPSQLSGGQKQRVALCRALAQDPSLFVLDEPIGHLDAKLRHLLRGEIRRRQKQRRQGTLWFTPDGIEAMAVADRMVVLIGGRVQQTGSPAEVFARPANVRVARLIGDPAMNVVPVRLFGGASPEWSLANAAPARVSSSLFDRLAPLARDGVLQLGLRPADLQVLPPGLSENTDGVECVPARVYAVEPLGKHTIVTLEVGDQRLRAKVPPGSTWAVGAPVTASCSAAQLLSFDSVSGELHRPLSPAPAPDPHHKEALQ